MQLKFCFYKSELGDNIVKRYVSCKVGNEEIIPTTEIISCDKNNCQEITFDFKKPSGIYELIFYSPNYTDEEGNVIILQRAYVREKEDDDWYNISVNGPNSDGTQFYDWTRYSPNQRDGTGILTLWFGLSRLVRFEVPKIFNQRYKFIDIDSVIDFFQNQLELPIFLDFERENLLNLLELHKKNRHIYI